MHQHYILSANGDDVSEIDDMDLFYATFAALHLQPDQQASGSGAQS
jgi:hypothetical protein